MDREGSDPRRPPADDEAAHRSDARQADGSPDRPLEQGPLEPGPVKHGPLERRAANVTPAGAGAAPGEVVAGQRRLPQPVVMAITTGWPALWIIMFVVGPWWLALILMFMTGPIMAVVHGRWDGPDSRRRRLERHEERRRRVMARRGRWHYGPPLTLGTPAPSYRTDQLHPAPRADEAPSPPSAHTPTQPSAQPPTQASTSAAERALAATVIRAESHAWRLDADALDLVREVDHLLRPLLAHVRARGTDPLVRRDLEAIATEHLPGALDAYLVLPADYAREHRTATGTTPADELRAQLTTLVEGCRQLRDAVHDADVDRQQQLSRYLDAKFRRSDLDL